MIAALPAGVRSEVDARLDRVRLPHRATIYEPGAPIRTVYFPVDAVISVVTVMRDGKQIEVVTVGREGIAGAQGLLDGAAPSAMALTTCQVSGDAFRMRFDTFAELCARHEPLRAAVERYLSAQLDVMAQSIACSRLHSVGERCARWLLMMHDRVGRDEFPLTHEMLAAMLGVRRAGVSITVAGLQDAGSITYSRGRFRVVDRAALRAASCECYEAIDEAFSRRRLPQN